MGNVRFGIPIDAVRTLMGWRPYQVAIETGTFEGASAQALSDLGLSVVSVEHDVELVRLCRQRLAGRNVTIVHANSSVALPSILKDVPEPAIFWLDAHWFYRQVPTRSSQCPLLDELRAVCAWRLGRDSVVLVDDVSLFSRAGLSPDHREEDWPTIEDIYKLVHAGGSSLGGHLWSVVEDVLFLLPADCPVNLI